MFNGLVFVDFSDGAVTVESISAENSSAEESSAGE